MVEIEGEIVPLDDEGEELMQESDLLKELTAEELNSELLRAEEKLRALQSEKARRKELEGNK